MRSHARKQSQPLYFSIAQVRRAIGTGWSARRVRRWLWRAGALEKIHGVVVTTPERLMASFPDVYRRLLENEQEDDEDDE